jgi:NADPH-dependent 2,4-dienoyl-CoA reductase/sulfur reductase-like enzyme
MKLVIVGGVAGGASAAARAHRLPEGANIIAFDRGPDVSFANCGLPYYVGGEIAERDKLLVVTPEGLRDRFRLDVRVRTSVEAIDRAAKSVRARDLATGREYDEPYDKLILAPGAAPLRHRPARHLHAAGPPGRGPDQGAGGLGRRSGRRGRRRIHRPGDRLRRYLAKHSPLSAPKGKRVVAEDLPPVVRSQVLTPDQGRASGVEK